MAAFLRLPIAVIGIISHHFGGQYRFERFGGRRLDLAESRTLNPEPRLPAIGRGLPFWQFSRPSACPPLAGSLFPVPAPVCLPLQRTNDKGRMTVVPRCFSATSYPQRRMPKSACQKPSNSCQNRSKRRRFPSKSDQNRAHFIMPILTFRGVTPSGASAKADLGFRKGQKPCFRGSEMPCGKVIHNRKKLQERERGTGNGERQATVPGCELRLALRYRSCEKFGML